MIHSVRDISVGTNWFHSLTETEIPGLPGGQQQDLCASTSKKTVKDTRVERNSHKLRTAYQGRMIRNIIIGRVMIIDTSH